MNELERITHDYGPYLEDLRARLFDLAISFLMLFVAGFFGAGYFVKAVTKYMNRDDVTIMISSPFQFMDLAVDVGLFVALIVIIPFVIWNIYAFLQPGLTRREKFIFLLSLPLVFILFLLGFSYGATVMFLFLGAIAKINTSLGLKNLWDVSLFLTQMALTSTLLGILFLFPIAVSFLVKIGLVDPGTLIKNRRLSMLVIFIFVSLLPPTDGLSLVVMSLPLVALYELTIIFNQKKFIL